jgi:hypothetical protein
MKVTETTQNQDGSTTVREVHIPFRKGISQISRTLVPENSDEPISVHIIESGWKDNGPMYHILVEYGDYMQTDYQFGNFQFICEMFPEFRKIIEDTFVDVIITSEEIHNTPNAGELGALVRKKSIR